MRDGLGESQTLLVLGGSSEIGLACARALVARSTRRIVLAGRSPERLGAAAATLRADGAEDVDTIALEAEESAGQPAVVERAFARLGDVDVVLLAIGTLPDQQRAEHDPELAAATMRVNLAGPVALLTAAADRLRAQGHGAIVVLSSVAAERPRRANFVYGASKAGLDAYAQGLGDALVGTGVDVLVVRPGFVRTRMTAGLDAAPFATTAEAVAAAVVRGLERRSGTVWVPGHLRALMIVVRHLPRAVFRRLPG